MNIIIDEKEIIVSDPSKNIVEIGDENGITITAPCFRDTEKSGCCKACLIEIDGKHAYACGTKPTEGMVITYQRDDLAAKRKKQVEQYAIAKKSPFKSSSSCCG